MSFWNFKKIVEKRGNLLLFLKFKKSTTYEFVSGIKEDKSHVADLVNKLTKIYTRN